jgi:hypothetical protein
MENKTKNILITIASVVGVSLLIRYAIKKRNETTEKKSNLVDDMMEKMGKPINQFTITNNSRVSPQTISLFNIYKLNQNNNDVSIKPSMKFFNTTLLNDPKKVKSIKIIVNKSDFAQSQATEVITKVCKDASGNSSTENYYPMVDVNQFQGNITEVKPQNLILDGICYLDYTIQPNTTVTMIIEYKTQYRSGKKRKKMF